MVARGAVALVAAAVVAGSAVAGDKFNPLGDGSDYTNSDLMRDPTTGCENCQSNPPHEWNDPFFDIDWSLALRGSYVQATGGSYFEASAVPSVTLRHDMLRGGYEASASVDIVRSTIEDVRVAAARGGFAGSYELDETTSIGGNLDFALSQASAKAPGTPPTVAIQPLVFSGDGEVSASKELGQFVVTGRVNGGRQTFGSMTMVDMSTIDNTHQNNWRAGAGLRVGYKVTPILTAFVDGSVGYQWYDAASPVYLVPLDAADYQVRTGVSATWNSVLEAEASIGYGLRRFADPMLGEAGSLLYDASITMRPDETIEAKGTFTTTFGAPGAGSGGTARLEYAASGDISYRVNPWLSLRASAGARYAQLIGTATTERGVNAGVGADYVLNEFTTINADYAYAWNETNPGPVGDEHRVTVGVTLSR